MTVRSTKVAWVVPFFIFGCALHQPVTAEGPPRRLTAAPEVWAVAPAPTAAPSVRFETVSGGAVTVMPAEPVRGASAGATWTEQRITLKAAGPARGRLVFVAGWDTVGAEVDGAPVRERRLGGPGGTRVLETEDIALAAGEERRVLVRMAGRAPAAPADSGRAETGTTILLLATSAARAYDLPREGELVRVVAREVLAADATLLVAAYDSRPELLFEGRAADAGPSLVRELAARRALGATDLDAALAWVADRARDEKVNRIVIVSDGVATAGETDPSALGLTVGRFPRGARVDWVVPGGARNEPVLASLATAHGGRGSTVSLHAPEDALVAALRGAPGSSADASPPAGAPDWLASVAKRPPVPPALPGRTAGAELIGALAVAGRPFLAVETGTRLDPMSADLDERAEPPHIADSARPEPETVARVAHTTDPGAPQAAPEPPGRLPPATIQGIVRRNFGRFRACYIDVVRVKPGAKGRVVVAFQVNNDGTVALAQAKQSEIAHPPFVACVVRAFEALSFPESPGGAISVTYPLAFGPADSGPVDPPAQGGRPDRPGALTRMPVSADPPLEPWLGDVKLVSDAIARGEGAAALDHAWRAWAEAPAAPLSYVMLGDALRAASRLEQAARATSSIADVAPNDPAALRSAAYRGFGTAAQGEHIEDWLVRAISVQPHDLDTARAVAELRALRGDIDSSLLILDGLLGNVRGARRTAGEREVLRADLSLLAAALVAREPPRRAEIERWAAAVGVTLPDKAVFRASVLAADESADLDLVVSDVTEARATRHSPGLATGGRLVATTPGGGPEAFLSDGRRAYPYEMELLLASRGGAFTTGVVDVLEHDGRGGLNVVGMPFVIQVEKGQVRAGRLDAPPGG